MKKNQEDSSDTLFKKIIKDTIAEEGYFKEKDIKQLINNILKEINPLIADQVKKHFYDIGHYIVRNSETNINSKQIDNTGDKKDAKTS